MARKVISALAIVVIFYLGAGLAFHLKWQSAQDACRETRRARGEFVEPEVLGGALGLLFDVTNWPIYAWANMYHFGTPFATPCDHSGGSRRVPWRITKNAEQGGASRTWLWGHVANECRANKRIRGNIRLSVRHSMATRGFRGVPCDWHVRSGEALKQG